MTIPERPTRFAADCAPDWCEVKLDAYKTTSGGTWWKSRPTITPRLQLVHTNGASNEGSIESAINWGNQNPTANTHPHYQVDRDRAAKLVPTDRRGIGNATVDAAQDGHGDVGEWSIVIETADEGYPDPGERGGFIGNQVEMIAQILAYESMVHRIPLAYPLRWYDPGTATHTDPFEYPYYTIKPGKVCPGRTKKQQMREVVLPRAIEIRNAWSAASWPPPEPPEDDDMTPLAVPERVYDSRLSGGPLAPHVARTIPVGMCSKAHVHVTVISTLPGWVSISGTDTPSPTSLVNFDGDGVESAGAPIGLPDGKVRVTASAACDICVDVYARG